MGEIWSCEKGGTLNFWHRLKPGNPVRFAHH